MDSPPSLTDKTIKTHDSRSCKANVEQSLVPITPDSNKENGDFPLDFGSPVTAVKILPKALIFGSKTKINEDPVTSVSDLSSPRTPKDGVFDPFAPGPDDKILAPLCKKYFDEARASVARRLNFGSSFNSFRNRCFCHDDAESISDEEVFESVYESLLEAIVFTQTEDHLEELSKNMEWDSDDCMTPPSAPIVSGAVETCPGAPMKLTDVFFCTIWNALVKNGESWASNCDCLFC